MLSFLFTFCLAEGPTITRVTLSSTNNELTISQRALVIFHTICDESSFTLTNAKTSTSHVCYFSDTGSISYKGDSELLLSVL